MEFWKKKVHSQALQWDIKGLFILSPEGLNCSFAGLSQGVLPLKAWLEEETEQVFFFKDSFCDYNPFRRLKVVTRKEIVTYNTSLKPKSSPSGHLSPSQWHEALKEDDVVVIDARNDFEVQVGQFKKALNPKIKNFKEFSKWLKDHPLDKKRKTLLYCTGGVRCEKAILDMKAQGFEDVHQLEGGVLNYLKEFPHKSFLGECFVFDHRVALDQNLKTSKKYFLCVHCGDPASSKIMCSQCHKKEFVCKSCFQKNDNTLKTCSKNCRHHFHLQHKTRRRHKDSLEKRPKPVL